MSNNKFSPFAEILTAIGTGRAIQFKSALGESWIDIPVRAVLHSVANGSADVDFLRVKPLTQDIGGVEVPAPLCEAPAVGERYFFLKINVDCHVWCDDDTDRGCRALGIYTHQDDALAVCAALQALIAPKD